MQALVAKWDHAQDGKNPPTIKQREFPIDTKFRIRAQGFSTMERLDRGVWVPELTTPGDLYIEGRAF